MCGTRISASAYKTDDAMRIAVQPWTLNKSMTGVIELRRDQNLTSLPKVIITRN